LKSGIAGEILQKFSNYGVSLAIVGDFPNIQARVFEILYMKATRMEGFFLLVLRKRLKKSYQGKIKMTAIDFLATSLNRRDEVPNQELASEIIKSVNQIGLRNL
jgi:hypothetical protein